MNLRILDFPIDINEVVYENSLSDDLRIDKTNLDEEFATQAEKFAYYAAASELAKSQLEHLKNELEVLYAQIDHEKRAAAQSVQSQNPKFKFTEKMCENEVITDKRYLKKKKQVLAAKKLAGLLSVGKEAFSHRRDSLISLGANSRIGASDTRILTQTAKARIQQRRDEEQLTNNVETTDPNDYQPTEPTQQPDATSRRRRRPTAAKAG